MRRIVSPSVGVSLLRMQRPRPRGNLAGIGRNADPTDRLGGLLLEAVVDGDVLGRQLQARRLCGLLDQDREVAVGVAGLHELVDVAARELS